MKKERRWKPEVVLELKSSTYGIPDAGQAFAMFMQGLHIKKCGLIQCEVDPAIYYRIEEESRGESKEGGSRKRSRIGIKKFYLRHT